MELKLEVPMGHVIDTNKEEQNLVVSRDAGVANYIRLNFGEFEAILSTDEFKSYFGAFLL
ncbi:hypothetical protein [Lysinibacillus sp. NPDC086135]|uniref:hypothetical protein n=1 Tax=Lysinibacillus sp. NPDC086135 TaxID=3364130 RepID=UPI0038264989